MRDTVLPALEAGAWGGELGLAEHVGVRLGAAFGYRCRNDFGNLGVALLDLCQQMVQPDPRARTDPGCYRLEQDPGAVFLHLNRRKPTIHRADFKRAFHHKTQNFGRNIVEIGFQ